MIFRSKISSAQRPDRSPNHYPESSIRLKSLSIIVNLSAATLPSGERKFWKDTAARFSLTTNSCRDQSRMKPNTLNLGAITGAHQVLRFLFKPANPRKGRTRPLLYRALLWQQLRVISQTPLHQPVAFRPLPTQQIHSDCAVLCGIVHSSREKNLHYSPGKFPSLSWANFSFH